MIPFLSHSLLFLSQSRGLCSFFSLIFLHLLFEHVTRLLFTAFLFPLLSFSTRSLLHLLQHPWVLQTAILSDSPLRPAIPTGLLSSYISGMLSPSLCHLLGCILHEPSRMFWLSHYLQMSSFSLEILNTGTLHTCANLRLPPCFSILRGRFYRRFS